MSLFMFIGKKTIIIKYFPKLSCFLVKKAKKHLSFHFSFPITKKSKINTPIIKYEQNSHLTEASA